MVTMNNIDMKVSDDNNSTNINLGMTNNNMAAIASALAALVQHKSKTVQADANTPNGLHSQSQPATTQQPQPQQQEQPPAQFQQQSLFTIEQIELVRRIKNSGMTKEQLIIAYDSLDRVEQELGHLYTVPISLAQQQLPPLGGIQPLMAQLMGQNAMGAQAFAVLAAQENLAHQLQTQQSQTEMIRKRSIDQVEGSEFNDSSATAAKLTNGRVHSQNISNNSQSSGALQSHNVFPELDAVEETEEYKEFILKGEPYCYEQVRDFVLRYNIKQQQVAILAGISQSYVSRYFKGDFHDMSERSRRAIQKWYILFRKNPAAIGPSANSMMMNNNTQVTAAKKATCDAVPAGDFTSYPRRERFVFRSAHLDVLESYFNIDSYPSSEKREEIARVCNGSLELGGRPLTERETVTSQVVGNWFANKRKEVKKLAREEGIDPSQMCLKGRGRPSRFGHLFNDLMTSNRMSPTESSNSEGEQVVQNGSNADNKVGDYLYKTTVSYETSENNGHNEEQLQLSNGNHIKLLSTENDVNILTSSQLCVKDLNESSSTNILSDVISDGNEVVDCDPEDKKSFPNDEQSLSLAVEMAAVNQAILSLSGQNPININGDKIENNIFS